jgi:hypothetical protein
MKLMGRKEQVFCETNITQTNCQYYGGWLEDKAT